jgi:hypothetical protein
LLLVCTEGEEWTGTAGAAVAAGWSCCEAEEGVEQEMLRLQDSTALIPLVRNRTLTLIEREDDTRSWGNFLVYFSNSTTMPCPPRGWRYIFIGC